MKKISLVIATPIKEYQGVWEDLTDESLEETKDFLESINRYTYIDFTLINDDIMYISKGMIDKCVFFIKTKEA